MRRNDFFIAILIFVTIHVMCATAATTKPPRILRTKTCQTKACADLAKNILSSMNQTVNPCDDFYQYSCGSFLKNAVIPIDKASSNFISDIGDSIRQNLKDSIENQITDKDIDTFKKLKQYYKICLNEDEINKNGKREFLEVLKRLGGWPIVEGDSWDEKNFDWIESMYKLRKEGYTSEHFISFGILNDLKNNSKNLLYLDQPSLSITREVADQGINSPLLKAYYKFMYQFAILLNVDPTIADRDLTKAFEFEIALANITSLSSQRRDIESIYNPMTVKELNAKYPKLPIVKHLNRLMAPKDKLTDNDVVVVSELGYYEKLADLLAKTPKRVQANFVFWRVALSSVGQIGSEFREVYNDYTSLISGNKAKSDRWKLCVSQMDSTFYLATGALYVRNHFDKTIKDIVLQMIENLRTAFRTMISKVTWMDVQTKNSAIEKLNKILPLVGYPDELLSNSALDNYYKDLKIDPTSYFKSVRNTNIFFASKTFDNFRKPVDKADWTGLWGAATTVNAFYSPNANSINFPSGILQGSFFNKDLPRYVNYGRLGSIVGHEMTHGFDDQGRLFDKNGNKLDWWGLKTKNEFLKRADCIINQYSNYTVKEVGLHVDGRNTQGENIADNGGVKESYLAYNLYLKNNPEEPRLPGLEKFTQKQTFWLANANSWCIKYRPEYVKNAVLLDTHSPNEFRVIGMFSNVEEFSKDFNCPVGSRMNPKKKCTVW